jgi:hypothetical protein
MPKMRFKNEKGWKLIRSLTFIVVACNRDKRNTDLWILLAMFSSSCKLVGSQNEEASVDK